MGSQGKERETARMAPARIAAAGGVVSAHLVMIALLASHGMEARRHEVEEPQPMIAEILAAAPSETPMAGEEFVPNIQQVELSLPDISMALQPEVAIDAPRIDPGFTMDVAFYAARAGLAPGTRATVLLLLDIAEDGSVISAQVVRSDANDAGTSAAVEYARATRWTPGMIDGEPRAMQASLTVVLGERV